MKLSEMVKEIERLMRKRKMPDYSKLYSELFDVEYLRLSKKLRKLIVKDTIKRLKQGY